MDANRIWMDFIINDGENIWLSSGKDNGLFRYDKALGKLHFCGGFPGEKPGAFRLYNSGIKYEKKLIFAPFHAKTIAIYDTYENKFTMLPIEKKLSGRIPFCNIFVWKEFVYLIATGYKCVILKLNMKTYKVKKIEYEIEQLDLSVDFMCREVIVVDDILYCAFKNVSKILAFDFSRETFMEYTISSGDGFGTIAFHNGNIWLSEKKKIICWSCLEHNIEVYEKYPDEYGMQVFSNGHYEGIKKGFQDEYSKWHQPFFKSRIISDKLFLLSAEMDMSLLVDTVTGKTTGICLCEMESIQESEKNCIGPRISVLKYLFLDVYGEDLFFYSTRDNQLYCCKKNFTEISKLDMQLDECDMLNYLKTNSGMLYEMDMDIGLQNLMNYVIRSGIEKSRQNLYNNYGKLIYNEFRKDI